MNLSLIAAGVRMIADGLEENETQLNVVTTKEGNVVQHPSTPAPQPSPPATVTPEPTPDQVRAAAVWEAKQASETPVAAGGLTATVDDVVALFQELEQTHGKLDMAPLFQELGIERVSAATPEQRGALVARMKQTWVG